MNLELKSMSFLTYMAIKYKVNSYHRVKIHKSILKVTQKQRIILMMKNNKLRIYMIWEFIFHSILILSQKRKTARENLKRNKISKMQKEWNQNIDLVKHYTLNLIFEIKLLKVFFSFKFSKNFDLLLVKFELVFLSQRSE